MIEYRGYYHARRRGWNCREYRAIYAPDRQFICLADSTAEAEWLIDIYISWTEGRHA